MKKYTPYIRYLYSQNEIQLDKIGKQYFSKANEFLKKHCFKDAFNNINLGFDNIVCDCKIGMPIDYNIENVLVQSKSFDCSLSEINFISSYIYWIIGNYNKADAYINNYLQDNKNLEIGYYLKGRILSDKKNYNEALNFFQTALKFKCTNRSLYRIGRIKEDIFNENGIAELYQASLSNVISHCCGQLAKNCKKRGIILNNSESSIIKSFNNGGDLFYYYSELNEIKIDNFKKEKFEFLRTLIQSKNFFENTKDIQNNIDDYHEYDDIDEKSFSYYLYGGAYGYDDETINTAFEGDPENQWNVD